MQIGLITDSVGRLSFDEALDLAQRLHLNSVEVATGNWSEAPHIDLAHVVASDAARDEFAGKVADRGLKISALNANGNQLHPVTGPQHDRVLCDTIDLASSLGVPTVVCMSGLPAARNDSVPNWITSSWPPENVEVVVYQWEEVAIPYWKELAAFARDRGVRLAVEACFNQLVYSSSTMLRLIESTGEDVVGANLDPSHLMGMGADIPTVIRTLASRYSTSTPRTHGSTPSSRPGTACSPPIPWRRPTSAHGTTSPSALATPPVGHSGPTSSIPSDPWVTTEP